MKNKNRKKDEIMTEYRNPSKQHLKQKTNKQTNKKNNNKKQIK